MDRAMTAGRLAVTEGTTLQAAFGVFEQLRALVTDRGRTMMRPTIKPNHHPHRFLFVPNAHHDTNPITLRKLKSTYKAVVYQRIGSDAEIFLFHFFHHKATKAQ